MTTRSLAGQLQGLASNTGHAAKPSREASYGLTCLLLPDVTVELILRELGSELPFLALGTAELVRKCGGLLAVRVRVRQAYFW